jgi:hypothetical protein
MSPARKRLALLFVVMGSALILERVVAFASADDTSGSAATINTASTGSATGRDPAGQRAGSRAIDPALDGQAGVSSSVDAVEPGDSPASDVQLRLDRLAAAAQPGVAIGRLFEPRRWQVPPPAAPVVVAVAPARPVAPAFPYSYFGGMTDGDQRIGFFQRGERVVTVRAGDTVDGNFRIDQISASHMTYTYLPAAAPTTLTLGGPR